jgi:hypothetical protein
MISTSSLQRLALAAAEAPPATPPTITNFLTFIITSRRKQGKKTEIS